MPHRQRLCRLALALACVLALAACGTTGPGGLRIDRSIQAKSQNSRVEFVVLHYTAADNPRSLLILSKGNVSSHYLLTRDLPPQIFELVDESRRAWHAGASSWYGYTGINAASIGIEIVNAGKGDQGWNPYTPEQTAALTALLHDIVQRHQIKPMNIVGHSDIAPQRKLDPGPLFPWKQLAQAGLGRWYDETLAATYADGFMRDGLPGAAWFQQELKRVGYETPSTGVLDKATRNVLAAFQMHYRPSRHDGQPDFETAGILKALR